jgi:hypothetical protein
LVMAAGTLFVAQGAQADSVQVQSYQRAVESEACTAQVGETPWESAWGVDASWSPSWSQWANNGQGGWTCNRSIVWERSPAAGSSARGPRSLTTCPDVSTCAPGDIGPGGGLVFYSRSGTSEGTRYEMAPAYWGGFPMAWSGNTTDALLGTLSGIGAGAANTALMIAQAGGGSDPDKAATSAVAYRGGGLADWYLPSKYELNAMCLYSRNLVSAPDWEETCSGTQDVTFAASPYTLPAILYWTSTQSSTAQEAFAMYMGSSSATYGYVKALPIAVRPIRSF